MYHIALSRRDVKKKSSFFAFGTIFFVVILCRDGRWTSFWYTASDVLTSTLNLTGGVRTTSLLESTSKRRLHLVIYKRFSSWRHLRSRRLMNDPPPYVRLRRNVSVTLVLYPQRKQFFDQMPTLFRLRSKSRREGQDDVTGSLKYCPKGVV